MYRIEITKIAAEHVRNMDGRTQRQVLNKIESLREEPFLLGKALKGPLRDLRSVRATGQRYRIIYKVQEAEIIVIIVAVGIREEGDKKDVYALMRKLINIGLIDKEKES